MEEVISLVFFKSNTSLKNHYTKWIFMTQYVYNETINISKSESPLNVEYGHLSYLSRYTLRFKYNFYAERGTTCELEYQELNET